MLLTPKYCIFLMKVLNLFFHCFYTHPLAIAIIFGIVFISFFQMYVIFIVEIAIKAKLLLELMLQEMLLGDFREGLKMFISETRGVIKPTPLNYFFKAKLVTHYKTLNISKVNISKQQKRSTSTKKAHKHYIIISSFLKEDAFLLKVENGGYWCYLYFCVY